MVRVFDALNDPRNLEAAIKFVKEYGGHCETAISYTVSPVHSLDYFVKLACELEKMGEKEVYLLTDHTEFYERCGFEFFTMVEGEDGDFSRCYKKVL